MNDNSIARLGARTQSRRAQRAVSAGLLAMATVAGVHLGLGGPAVSPVSPVAIAARYGAPPVAVAAMPPVVQRVVPQGRQRGRHDGGRA